MRYQQYLDLFWRAKNDPNLFVTWLASPDPEDEKKKYVLSKDEGDGLGPGQKEFIEAVTSGKYDEAYMAGGNSSGKTWTAKFLAMICALYKIKPGKAEWKDWNEYKAIPYSVLCTGPEQKQSTELWEHIEAGFKSNPFLKSRLSEITTSTRRDTHPKIVLKNGSQIDGIGMHDKGKHIEGETYDLILINEPADVRHLLFIKDKVLVPRTWRRGGVICGFGTPKGQQGSPGEYYDLFKKGMRKTLAGKDNPFYDQKVFMMFVDSRKNRFADQEKISRTLESGDKALIDERVRGLFVETGTGAFSNAALEAIIDEKLKEKTPLTSGMEVIHGVDFGRKGDATVCVTLDIRKKPFTLVNFYRQEPGLATWAEIFNDLKTIHREYGGEFVADTTGSSGDMQAEWLGDLGIPFIPFQFSNKPTSKVAVINNLQNVIEKKEMQIPYIYQLIEELRNYPKNLDDKGMVTDSVIALSLAAWGASESVLIGETESYRR